MSRLFLLVLVSLLLAPPAHAGKVDASSKLFSAAMLEAVNARDPDRITALVDFDSIVARGADGLDAPADLMRGFLQGMKVGSRESGLVRDLILTVEGGGGFKYLGAKNDHSGEWAVFRLLPAAGGFNHISFLLHKDPQGVVRAKDFLILSSGELASALSRRLILPMAADANKNLLQKMVGKESLLVTHVEDMHRIQQAMAAQNPTEGLAIYATLPKELREDKLLMLMRLAMVSPDQDAEYRAVLSEMERLFPTDSATAVARIDAHFLRGDYEASARAIDTVAASTVPDPYFGALKSSVLNTAGKFAEAEAVARAAATQEPTLTDAWWGLIYALTQQKKYEEAVQADEAARLAGLVFDYASVEAMTPLLASEPYTKAAAAREAAP
ncbi:MAG: hypothetical protein KDA24_11315 [Deltaproteobacteria bacterium]|nr:hypothetical protein [Deltaproteobacteria bacterium]